MFSFFKPKNKGAYEDNNRTNDAPSNGFVDAVGEKASDIAEAASETLSDARENIEEGAEKVQNALFTSLKRDDDNDSEERGTSVSDEIQKRSHEIKEGASETADALEDGAARSLARLRGDFAPEADVVADAKADEAAREAANQGQNFDSNEDEDQEDIETDVDLEGADIKTEEEAYVAGDNDESEGSDLEDVDLSDLDGGTEEADDAEGVDEEENAVQGQDDFPVLRDGEVQVIQNPFAHENLDDEAFIFGEQDVIGEVIDEEEQPENHGVAEFEPSTEERGDADAVPNDEDLEFINSDDAYDDTVDGGRNFESEEVSDEDAIDAAFIKAEQDNGYVAVIIDGIVDDEEETGSINNSVTNKIDNNIEKEDETQDRNDVESYLSPLDEENKVTDLEKNYEEDPIVIEESAEEEFIDGLDDAFGDTEDVTIGEVTVDVTPIVFADCENNEEFTARIRETLDNREVFVFDFTENKSGYSALPDTVKPQSVDLPEGDVSPLDARTVLNAAYDHPGSAIVIVGPEVIAEEMVGKFEPGTQAYAIIVETIVKILQEAAQNDIEVVTIGAETNILIDDVISATL